MLKGKWQAFLAKRESERFEPLHPVSQQQRAWHEVRDLAKYFPGIDMDISKHGAASDLSGSFRLMSNASLGMSTNVMFSLLMLLT